MRLSKSLLCGFSALALSAGAAFAGQGYSSNEMSPPELLSDESSVMELERADQDAGAMDRAEMETEVIYIYPVEVTEYYIIIPESQDLG